jgi:hypothetical protein
MLCDKGGLCRWPPTYVTGYIATELQGLIYHINMSIARGLMTHFVDVMSMSDHKQTWHDLNCDAMAMMLPRQGSGCKVGTMFVPSHMTLIWFGVTIADMSTIMFRNTHHPLHVHSPDVHKAI